MDLAVGNYLSNNMSVLLQILPSPIATASLAASTLTFTSQPVGSTSSAQTVTLNDTGTAPLAITSITASGDFTATNTCGTTVAAGGGCTINITFTPTAGGARTGSLAITDNSDGIAGGVQTVALIGTATAPAVSLSAPLTFAAQLIGATSSSQSITLTNSGNASLTFTAAPTVTGPFAIAASGTTCSTANRVAAAATCTVAVTFTPAAGGASAGSVSFSDNAPGSPQTVVLSGTSEDFTFTTASGSSATPIVTPGQAASYTLSVGGQGGLSGAVTFTCTGDPSQSTCTVSPNPLTVGSSAANVTVTVSTTAASMGSPQSRPLPPAPPFRRTGAVNAPPGAVGGCGVGPQP